MLGLDAAGERVFISQPAWRENYGFWMTFELMAQLAAQGFTLQERERRDHVPMFTWRADVRPGSRQEQRQLIGAQMRVAQSTLRHLAGAQVVVCDPAELDGIDQFESHADAQRWGAGARLPWPAVYLDLCAPGRTHVAAMPVQPGQPPWGFAGALLFRQQPSDPLSAVIFASPGGEEGPEFQPLAHIMLADGAALPAPEPGEIAVDADSGQSVTPLVSDPRSRIAVRTRAALSLLTGALSLLAHITSPDVELVFELRNPAARQRVRAAGRQVALAPRARRGR